MTLQSGNQFVSVSPSDTGKTARSAFQEVMEYRRMHPFPKDMDWEKIREAAIAEKYGRFD